jgi:LuxR family transcriptional regulator, quorum-sensing system regulator BjaR1
VLTTMAPEYIRAYDEQDFSEVDRGFPAGLKAAKPFKWLDLQRADTSPKSRAFLAHAEDYYIDTSVIVPVRDSMACRGLVGLSGREFDPPSQHWPLIELICNYAFEEAQALLGKVTAFTPLTDREREVLTWIANGKSAWEIGQILNIGSRTVETHTVSILQKLNVGNRAYAVAIAMRHKLIDP